jgi:hypothetical protein
MASRIFKSARDRKSCQRPDNIRFSAADLIWRKPVENRAEPTAQQARHFIIDITHDSSPITLTE